MATRSKTVWYAAQLVADVVDNTLTSLGTITVYTENSSRVFKSCLVWTHFEDIVTATGGTLRSMPVPSVSMRHGDHHVGDDDIANTGENISGVSARGISLHDQLSRRRCLLRRHQCTLGSKHGHHAGHAELFRAPVHHLRIRRYRRDAVPDGDHSAGKHHGRAGHDGDGNRTNQIPN